MTAPSFSVVQHEGRPTTSTPPPESPSIKKMAEILLATAHVQSPPPTEDCAKSSPSTKPPTGDGYHCGRSALLSHVDTQQAVLADEEPGRLEVGKLASTCTLCLLCLPTLH